MNTGMVPMQACLREGGGRTARDRAWRASAIAVAALMPVAAAFAACGDDMTGPEVIEEVEFASSLGINLATFTRTSSGLYYEDIEQGSGDPAAAGQEARVAYAGWLTDGTEFDRGEFSFTLGAGQVVPGFDEGVQGMRAGGIRRIIIPPALGYGSQGQGAVPPNAIMIFRIELLSIG